MGVAVVLIGLLLIMGCCLAFVGLQGMWGAALSFVNVLLAALLATNYWEPLAKRLDDMAPSYTYLLDLLTVWLLFCVFLALFRVATDLLSRVKLRFIKPVDQAGGLVFGFLTGWVFICFMLMTLHMAPLSRNFLGFWQPEPQTRMLAVAPDRRWLGWFQHVSAGPLSKGNTFDPQAEFILKYGQRRADFEREPAFRVNR